MNAPARHRWLGAATGLTLVVVAAVAFLATREDDYVASPDGAGRPAAEPAEAARALAALEDAVASRDARRRGRPGGRLVAVSRACSRTVVANAESLDVEDFTLRYVDETEQHVGRRDAGPGRWT